jgi:hypothetical protein
MLLTVTNVVVAMKVEKVGQQVRLPYPEAAAERLRVDVFEGESARDHRCHYSWP